MAEDISGGVNRKLRRLLPRAADDVVAPVPPHPSQHSILPGTRQRNAAVPAACNACKKRKTKCDAGRPRCSGCHRRGEECGYSTEPSETRQSALKRKHDELEHDFKQLQDAHATLAEFVDSLRSRSPGDAAAILRRLREGADVEAIMLAVRGGDLLLQLQLIPETRYRYTFPLQEEMPLSLRAADVPYLHSLVYEATFATQAHPVNAAFKAQYLKPYHAAKLVDPRLDMVKPSMWTSVTDDDVLMRALLRLYLQHEYHFFTCFHKDYFLDDMLSGSKRFCSSLLVNAVLAQACHCHLAFKDRLEYWNPNSLGYRFFAEAKRLWEEEQRAKSSLTVVQADMIINIMFNMHSMDKIGMTYAVHAVAMAHDLKLFDPPAPARSQRRQHAYDFTAWNLFWWTNLQCYHFLIAPLLKAPPHRPLPDPDQEPGWYGETWIQYPLSQSLVSVSYGHFTKAKMELAQICNGLASRLFDVGGDDRVRLPSDTMTDFSTRLSTWYSSLPACLTPVEIVFPQQLKLHLVYHNIQMNLCELSIPGASIPATKVDSQSSVDRDGLLAHSRACFEAILRLYYLRHGYEYSDTYMTHELAVLGFMTLNRLKLLPSASPGATTDEQTELDEVRSTLVLAAKGLSDQGRNYYMPFTLFHIVRAEMSPKDIDLLYKWMDDRPVDSAAGSLRAKHVQAQYPVNIVNIADHPEARRLEDVIKKYADLALGGESPGGTSGDEGSAV